MSILRQMIHGKFFAPEKKVEAAINESIKRDLLLC